MCYDPPRRGHPDRLPTGAPAADRRRGVCPRPRHGAGRTARPERLPDSVFELVEGPPGRGRVCPERVTSTPGFRSGCSTSDGIGWNGRQSNGSHRPIDIVHSLHPLLIPSRSAAQVVTVHDLYFLDRPEHTSARSGATTPRWRSTHVRRADGVVVNSKYTGRQVDRARSASTPTASSVCYPGRPVVAATSRAVRAGAHPVPRHGSNREKISRA